MIKPLLVILSPRDIPHFEENFHKINYVDKLWVKYYNIGDAHREAEKYFNEHKEYTHIILVSDDGIPEYNSVAMLIADIEKYNFPCIAGVSTVDSLSDDMFLGVTQNVVVKELTRGVSRTNYECLPNEFRELNGLIKVWFEGNALLTLRRDVVEKVHLYHESNANVPWSEAGDLANSFYIAKAGYEIYADLRVYMQHYRWSKSTPPFNLLIGEKVACTIEEKATSEIPVYEPADVITNIPEKYKDLMDFYYGSPREIKICIVAEFPQANYFQWHVALNKISNSEQRYGGWFKVSKEKGHRIILSEIELNPIMMQAYSEDDKYWNPIKEADIVFSYIARQDMTWDWWSLPLLVKKMMNPKAKMICQFDDELWWAYKPEHSWWDKKYDINVDSPKEFFEKNKILDVADLYFTVLHNPWWSKYTNKPIVYMPLPQISRYSGDIYVPKVATTRKSEILQDKSLITRPEGLEKKLRMIATLRHSIRSSSVKNTIDNVLCKVGYPVYYFSSRQFKSDETITEANLPPRSKVITIMKRDGYMFMLRECYIAIDDNDGYIGWSRFAYECALSCVPCVGSTESIKTLFPDLYTEPHDYKKQMYLLNKLLTDKNFYDLMKYTGFIRATQELSDANLVTKFLKVCMWNLKDIDYIKKEEIDMKKIEQDFCVEETINKETKSDIYACYIVYNEEDKIALSLNSIVPYVDKVIMVDGAFSHFKHINPKSTDKTKEIAERICGDKLIWIDCPMKDNEYVPWNGQVDKRNAYMNLIPVNSWFYVMDADVILTGKVEELIINLRNNNVQSNVLAVRMINFYPTLSENSREVPPKIKQTLWEIDDIKKSGLTDWFKNNPNNPKIISPVNWIGYYGQVVCIYKKIKTMEYKNFHSQIYVGNKIYNFKWNIIPSILSLNMKMLNSFDRHCEMAQHKKDEVAIMNNTYKPELKTYTIEPTERILLCTPFCNEEHSMAQFMDGILSLDYPKKLIDLIWIENNSSDKTWELLNEYYEKFKSLGYNSHRLQQKTASYGSIIKQKYDEYGVTGMGGKIGRSNTFDVRKHRPAHQIGIWNDMLHLMSDEHDYILFVFADAVIQPDTIKRYIQDFKDYPDAGWLGGVMHKRFPRHERFPEQNPMHFGLASPSIKVIDNDTLSKDMINNETWILRNPSYPYGIRGITEEEVIKLQNEGHGIFEVCCTGHIFMIPRKVIMTGLKFLLAPIETALAVERSLNNLGLKMYCDSYVYIKHISVDGKIYCNSIKDINGHQPHDSTVYEKSHVNETPTDEEENFIKFLAKLYLDDKTMTPRPEEHMSSFDNISKRIITSADWDDIYGKWRPIIDNENLYASIQEKARNLNRKV